ncbi:MAG: tetratricopeptide repeat protein [Anaerolineae bacterium]|nr:tetratricopeptide repeat protein [Anaerolineae bacterium]
MIDAAPAGMFTFLFSDIEGSTRLWELYPEVMKPVLARHDDRVQQAVVANQGHVVKTTGDGCHAAFETAIHAVNAALAIQTAMFEDPWPEIRPHTVRVRIGLHTGEAEARAGDYFGTALNRAARLTATGHGGQVLVSSATAEMVRDQLPNGAALLDLGEHRLRDLIRPERVYQLVSLGLPVDFPPIRSIDAFPNNLPVQLTSFIGREREKADVWQALSSARLLTLTGVGGTGKTRLALHLAADVLSSFPDGVWLAELAPLAGPDLVLQAVAGALKLRRTPGMPLLDLVTDYMRGKSLLLILDNCEHLIDACARLAEHLLRHCPQVKILASSREPLGIAGEVTYTVPSLALPDSTARTPAALADYEAVQLFVERAKAVAPRFALTASNAQAVAQICLRLDGIPLALELAAARCKLFSAEQIASRLSDRFRLLTGGSRTALPRQQTLRALIDWSYDLLSEPERALLRQLSVFVGGWTFDAADAVIPDLDVLSLLEQLVNKSLVVVEEQHGQARYRMLETIRQYAQDRLFESGEGQAVRNRHLDYFLRLSEVGGLGLRGSHAFEWSDQLGVEYENIRAAAEWGEEQRPDDALLMLGNLFFFWGARVDNLALAVYWLRDLLARVEALPPPDDEAAARRRKRAQARGLSLFTVMAMNQGEYRAALEAIGRSIALERALDDPDRFWLALALSVQGDVALLMGDPSLLRSMRESAHEALALMHEAGETQWRLLALHPLSAIEAALGNLDEARRFQDEARLYLDYGDHPMLMPALLGLGIEARFQGRLDDARAYILKSLRIAQRSGSSGFEVALQSELVHIARLEGRLDEAKAGYRRLIRAWSDGGQWAAVAHQLECFAFIAMAEGEHERCARLFGAAEAVREHIGASMREIERQEYEATVAALRERLDASTLAAAWAAGRAMSAEKAIAFATATPVHAERVGKG